MNLSYRSPNKLNYVVEDVHNVKPLSGLRCVRCRRDKAKSGMNKSWSDNGVANFVQILSHLAQKYGVKIVKVNPRGTSQYCSNCLNRVSKTLYERWHDCDVCSLSCDRDYNSALLIKKLAVGSSQDKKLPSLAVLL